MAKEIIPCMKICFLGSSFIRKLSEKSETVTALLWSIGISLKWTPGYWVMRKVKNTDSIKNDINFIFFTSLTPFQDYNYHHNHYL